MGVRSTPRGNAAQGGSYIAVPNHVTRPPPKIRASSSIRDGRPRASRHYIYSYIYMYIYIYIYSVVAGLGA